MNQPGSGWAKQFRQCCAGNFSLSTKQEEQGCVLNHEGGFPPLKFKRLPLPASKEKLEVPICIIKGCFKVLIDNNNGNGVTCLGGCCPKHTKQYGKKGPPKIMKRTKTYQRKDLQVEESTVTTAHKIKQITTRRRLSDEDPWDYDSKYYDTTLVTTKLPRGKQICIEHGNQINSCTLGCAPCKHGENHPRSKCTACYPELECRTDKCDSIRNNKADDDLKGLCVYCISALTGNMTIEQINHKHLRELGYSLRTGFKHPSLTYFIDGTMKGEGHFDEINWENDEGTLKEGHACPNYTTEGEYQRMEDVHDAKSDLSMGSGMYISFSTSLV